VNVTGHHPDVSDTPVTVTVAEAPRKMLLSMQRLTAGSHVPWLAANVVPLICIPAEGVTPKVTSEAVVVGSLLVTVTE
jgi:hypothetical protein